MSTHKVTDPMELATDSFSDRLRKVISGRKIAPWADFMRIAPATRSRMLKDDGIPPTYETLARIMRVENASISWLLGGNTAPYLVYRPSDEESAGEAMAQLLEEEAGWQIHLLVSGMRTAWLLVQPAELDHPKGVIHYWAIALIAGPVGATTLAAIDQWRGGIVQGVHTLPEETMADLYEGHLGTWQLVGQPHDPTAGLVDARSNQNVNLTSAPPAQLRVADGAIHEPLQPLNDWWPLLADAERSALMTLLDPFLDNVRQRHQKASN
jgi:hypothetical protein